MTGFSRVLIALAVLGVPVTAAAQRATDEVQRVPPGWLLTPSVGFGGSWDDNLLLAGEGDRRLEDFAMPVNSGLRLDYRGRRLNVSSSYDGSFVMYRSYEELNSADQRAHFRLEHQATSRLKLTAEEQFIRAPSTDALNITGVPFYRTGSITNEAGGGFEAIVARYTTLNAGYVLRLVTFDQRADQQLDDGYEHDVSVSLGRAFSRRLKLGGHYGLRREVLSDGQDQFNIHESGVNVEYALSPTLVASGLVGVSVLGAGLTHDQSVGPAVQGQLVYRGKETRMSGSYQRSFVPAFGFGGTFQNEEWAGSIHFPLPIASKRIYMDSSVAWYDNDAIEEGQPSLQSLWVSAAVGYRAARWLNVEVYGGRTSQDTQSPGGDVRRNEAGIRVLLSRPVRIPVNR
jgi:hypothetical protein